MSIHIHQPEIVSGQYRILRRWRRTFEPEEFRSFEFALQFGMADALCNHDGFRIFRQTTFEWYEPTNVEVCKVAPAKKREPFPSEVVGRKLQDFMKDRER